MSETYTRNADGNWVEAIPEPLYGMRKACHCGRKFWTLEGYKTHYADRHFLSPCRRPQ